MSAPKKGWKVIMPYNKNKESSYMNLRSGGVRYYFSKWTKPKKGCGPLCVFSNYEDAKRFCPNELLIIYECLYVPYPVQDDVIWNRTQHYARGLPKGTVLAESVKLLKKKG